MHVGGLLGLANRLVKIPPAFWKFDAGSRLNWKESDLPSTLVLGSRWLRMWLDRICVFTNMKGYMAPLFGWYSTGG